MVVSLVPTPDGWEQAENITGDGLLLKQVIREGSGALCCPGWSANIKHQARVESHIFPSHLTCVTLRQDPDCFLAATLRNMREGELARFWIDGRLVGKSNEIIPWVTDDYEWMEDCYEWEVELLSCRPEVLTPDSSISIRRGLSMPRFGLGLYMVSPDDAYQATCENERSVGQALRDSRLPRENVFIVSKVNTPDHGYNEALGACQRSLSELGVAQIDLYLIHAPLNGRILETWDALLEARVRGWVRQVGVSNFSADFMQRLQDSGRELPAVNQIEVSPFCQEVDLRKFCQKRGIAVMGYSPLTRGSRLNDPRLSQIAQKHRRSNAQVMIRWALQQGITTIPKTTRRARLLENLDIFNFSLDDADLKEMEGLQENLHTCWDCLNLPWTS